MAKKASVYVHPAYRIGDISPRIYGAFLEPIGTMVNGSMYNPKHPTADDKGFRRDFIDSLKATGLPAVRLPGGNFISGWDWKDSIGPMEKRKAHLDLAWRQYIPNDVGHDEYLQWAERVGFEPLYTINLGTGGIEDAIKIIEYTNHEGGTYWSDLRAEYGHPDPYNVKVWYLGNEMDGPWQIASWEKDPRGYGIRANEVSKAMKWVDGSIETAACVSSSPFLAHYPQWDLEVLQECYEAVDYISMHHYHSAPTGDYAALLGGSVFFEDYINTEIGLCDFVQAKTRSPRKMLLSFDEYGSSMRPQSPLNPGYGPHNIYRTHYQFPDRKYIRHDPDNMGNRMGGMMRPQIGDMLGALANTSTILTFLRHADRVKIGCMTGGLGALTATDRDHVWKTASYYPYEHLIQYGRGVSMRTAVNCDTYDLPGYAMSDTAQYPTRTGIQYVDTAAALDEENGQLNVFVINRNLEEDTPVELDISGFAGYKFIEQIQLYSDDIDARNTYEQQDAIVPSVCTEAKFLNGVVSSNLKKLSWNVFRFAK